MTKKKSTSVLILSLILSLITLTACNQEASTESKVTKKANEDSVTSSKALKWMRWTPAAFEQAKQKKRLVLVDFSAEWCGFCKKMDKTTWRDPQVLAIIGENYIPVRVEDEVDPELAEKYRDYGRPAIIVLDAEGKEIFKKTGYLKPQWMLWTLQGVLQDQDNG
jgi:thiol:disulfide interchange protein